MSARNIIALSTIVIGLILIGFPDSVIATTKDGFNIYKDLLRGKGEEEEDMSELIADPKTGKVSYFYRTPPQIGLRSQTSGDLGKRTLNHFRNYMLGKESQAEEILRKRGAGSLFGWALTNQQNLDHE